MAQELSEKIEGLPVANKALDVIWEEEQINAMKDLMDMNEDYHCVDDILEDIEEFNPYKD